MNTTDEYLARLVARAAASGKDLPADLAQDLTRTVVCLQRERTALVDALQALRSYDFTVPPPPTYATDLAVGYYVDQARAFQANVQDYAGTALAQIGRAA